MTIFTYLICSSLLIAVIPTSTQTFELETEKKEPWLYSLRAFRPPGGKKYKYHDNKKSINSDTFLERLRDSVSQRLKETLKAEVRTNEDIKAEIEAKFLDTNKKLYNLAGLDYKLPNTKARLYELTVMEKKQCDGQIQAINRLLSIHRRNLSLKLVFIAQYFNLNYQKTLNLFYELPNSFDSYSEDQMYSLLKDFRASRHFLAEFLTILPSAMSVKTSDVRDVASTKKAYEEHAISWSYYDDTMSN